MSLLALSLYVPVSLSSKPLVQLYYCVPHVVQSVTGGVVHAPAFIVRTPSLCGRYSSFFCHLSTAFPSNYTARHGIVKCAFTYDPSMCCCGCNRGDDQARDFRGKTPADVIGEAVELPEGAEPDDELCEVIRRTLAGGMDLAQDAVQAAEEVCGSDGR